MTRLILFQAIALCLLGCNPSFKKPSLSSLQPYGVLIKHAGVNPLDLLAVNTFYHDTVAYYSLSQTDTLRGLECNTTYLFYFRDAGQRGYSFLDSIRYAPPFCGKDLAFSPAAGITTGGNYLVQDILRGAIYTIGVHGGLIYQLDSASGLLRGFDIQDSLLVWYSDSSKLTVKNLFTFKRRTISVDSTMKLHHDLTIHYPYATALYSKKNYKRFRPYNVVEEGLLRIDLRNGEVRRWSIHDFLPDGILPVELTTSSLVEAHGNSVDVDQNGDIYISFRDFNQVWKISSDFSRVHYRIGLNAAFVKSAGDHFMGQHSISIKSPDVFYLFDNGTVDQRQAKSRIVKISVNPPELSFVVENILALPDSLSTGKMGSVQALDDHLIISTFNKGFHILEIDTAGNLKNHLTRSKSNAIKVLPVKRGSNY